MALKDRIPFGVSLPHRSPDPIDMTPVRQVARRADALGFRDLWVTENTLDQVFCFDPLVVLTYAAAVTSRIRLGASVMVLPVHNPIHVAHQWASLDYVSGGRAILGVGLGREHHYAQFGVPPERRVAAVPRRGGADQARLWTEERVDYRGEFYRLEGGIDAAEAGAAAASADLDGGRPSRCGAPRRPARRWLDGVGRVEHRRLRANRCRSCGRRSKRRGATRQHFPISKRVFMAVDERPAVARAELHRWFTEVYHNPRGHRCLGHPRHARAGARAPRRDDRRWAPTT